MIILTTSTDPQEVKYIPRTLVLGTCYYSLIDEAENTTTTGTVTTSLDRYYNLFTEAFTLIEGRTYILKVFSDSGRTVNIFIGKVFCTDQTVADYSINDGVYNERTTTNEYALTDE